MSNERKSKLWRIHRIRRPNEEVFEILWRDDGDGVESYTYVATARQHSNARLIAAAPEMLAVLRAVRRTLAKTIDWQSEDDFDDSLSDALDAIDATIDDALLPIVGQRMREEA
jgi:hypothetical protein